MIEKKNRNEININIFINSIKKRLIKAIVIFLGVVYFIILQLKTVFSNENIAEIKREKEKEYSTAINSIEEYLKDGVHQCVFFSGLLHEP